jgi:hypothetical protein
VVGLDVPNGLPRLRDALEQFSTAESVQDRLTYPIILAARAMSDPSSGRIG